MGTGMNLKTSFYLTFFPMSRINSLQRAILNFEQYEEEFIGAARARFLALIHTIPDLSLSNSILLSLFYLGIDMGANLCLDVIAVARFTHKTMTEQVEFLEHFIDKHSSSIMRTKSL
jgi:hypothetical protein